MLYLVAPAISFAESGPASLFSNNCRLLYTTSKVYRSMRIDQYELSVAFVVQPPVSREWSRCFSEHPAVRELYRPEAETQ